MEILIYIVALVVPLYIVARANRPKVVDYFDARLVADNWGEVRGIDTAKEGRASITIMGDMSSIWRGSYRVQNEARWFTADGRYSMSRRGDWFLWRAIGEPERGRDMVFVDTFRTFEELDAYVRGELAR